MIITIVTPVEKFALFLKKSSVLQKMNLTSEHPGLERRKVLLVEESRLAPPSKGTKMARYCCYGSGNAETEPVDVKFNGFSVVENSKNRNNGLKHECGARANTLTPRSYYFALTRQIRLPASSATSSEPSGITDKPTGRPNTF